MLQHAACCCQACSHLHEKGRCAQFVSWVRLVGMCVYVLELWTARCSQLCTCVWLRCVRQSATHQGSCRCPLVLPRCRSSQQPGAHGYMVPFGVPSWAGRCRNASAICESQWLHVGQSASLVCAQNNKPWSHGPGRVGMLSMWPLNRYSVRCCIRQGW
jgi:hypothetical protein